MSTSLEEIGEPILGSGFEINFQGNGTGLADRTITRKYKMRAVDVLTYAVNLINPTLYDTQYPTAIIVDQSYHPLTPDKADGELWRVFMEVPSSWDEPGDRMVTFPGVLPSSLYGPRDFPFRSSQASLRTSVRVHHDYFITANQNSIPKYKKTLFFDPFGNQTSVLTDFTSPSVDEWIAKVAGGQEIVTDLSSINRLRGAVFDRSTPYAVCQ